MIFSKHLPTKFAKNIAIGCDLWIVDAFHNMEDHIDFEQRLITFQTMAISCSFESSLTAYFGIRLTDQQKEYLKIIYDTTKDWLMGHITGELLEKLSQKTTTGKEAADVAAIMIDNFVKKDSLSDKEKRGLLVRFSK